MLSRACRLLPKNSLNGRVVCMQEGYAAATNTFQRTRDYHIASRNGSHATSLKPHLLLNTKFSTVKSITASVLVRNLRTVDGDKSAQSETGDEPPAIPQAGESIFISFFMGLREMDESIRDGGLFWLADFTICDQFYGLPIITSLKLVAKIWLGRNSARKSAAKYILRALPIFIFPFAINFPGAILCYWACSNFFLLLQSFLHHTEVARFLQDRSLLRTQRHYPSRK